MSAEKLRRDLGLRFRRLRLVATLPVYKLDRGKKHEGVISLPRQSYVLHMQWALTA